jgi:quercetin dioxygenase-like cupin family protein
MKYLAATLASFAMVGGVQAADMVVTRNGSQPSVKGAAAAFTGSVRSEALFDAMSPSRTSGGLVTFDPGARSAWHTHPLGQTLIVTAGKGWVQQEGGARLESTPVMLSGRRLM